MTTLWNSTHAGGDMVPLRSFALFSLLVSCSPAPVSESAVLPGDGELELGAWSHVYQCDDGYNFSARTGDERVFLSLTGQAVELPQVPAASGTRYSDGAFTFWSHQGEASLETPSTRHDRCRARSARSPWEDAALRGVEYRGLGQEPGWYVEIDDDRSILFVGDYGESRIVTPVPPPARDSAAGRTTYHARTEASDLIVVIDEIHCADTMSGEEFPHQVSVVANGREYNGCGRPLAQ